VARKGEHLSAETRAKITGRPISSSEPGTVHQWLTAHHRKWNICEECGLMGRTDWAYLHHPQSHTRNRDDYRELCRRCHFKMDEAVYQRGAYLNTSLSTEQRREAGRRGAKARWDRSRA